MNKKLLKYTATLFPILLTIVFFFLNDTPLIRNPLNQIMDYKFLNNNFTKTETNDILIITIDDSSLQHIQEFGFSYPWPRIFYAKMLNFLKDAEAKSVFFDIIFNERDIDRDEISSEENDFAFSQALSENKNVYLASQLNNDIRFTNNLRDFTHFNFPSANKITQYKGIINPIKLFRENANNGFINVFPDSDGIIRKVKLLAKKNNIIIPSLVFQMYINNENLQLTDIKKNKMFFNNFTLNTECNSDFRLSWYTKDTFKYIPIKALIQSAIASEQNLDQTLDKNIFKDKVIFIGTTASGLMDNRSVPISENIPGVEIWATAYQNLLTKSSVKVNNRIIDSILCLIFSLAITFISLIEDKKSIFLALILIFIVELLDFYSWYIHHTQINIISIFSVVILSYIYTQTFNYILELRHKNALKKTFGMYLNDNLVEYIDSDLENVRLGGKESMVTALFTDIYDFTTISEKMKPNEIVSALNLYFNDLTQFILDNDGLLDKYTGDGIMAIFGSPIEDRDHALKACKALIQYKNFCENLKKKSTTSFVDQIHLNTRLALNSGTAITGNIGSKKRMDFTAIGDTINLAARLEAINKLYKTNFLISEHTYGLVKDRVVVRKLDIVQVKGKETPTHIYELLSFDNKDKKDFHFNYEEALSCYLNKDWEKAKLILEKQKDDAPSQKLLEKICFYEADSSRNWNAINKIYTK